MSEFFNMGGYAFYVWTSFGVFFLAMAIDFISLVLKEKSIKRNIRSLMKRKKKHQ